MSFILHKERFFNEISVHARTGTAVAAVHAATFRQQWAASLADFATKAAAILRYLSDFSR
jgi:hypothetical protein